MTDAATTFAEQYPECTKLREVSDVSQKIGEFLEWLTSERGLVIADWVRRYPCTWGFG